MVMKLSTCCEKPIKIKPCSDSANQYVCMGCGKPCDARNVEWMQFDPRKMEVSEAE